jgi:hypothetical protein
MDSFAVVGGESPWGNRWNQESPVYDVRKPVTAEDTDAPYLRRHHAQIESATGNRQAGPRRGVFAPVQRLNQRSTVPQSWRSRRCRLAAGKVQAQPVFRRQAEQPPAWRAAAAVGNHHRGGRAASRSRPERRGRGRHLAGRLAPGGAKSRGAPPRRPAPAGRSRRSCALPVAEVDLLEARVEPRRAQGLGEQAGAAQAGWRGARSRRAAAGAGARPPRRRVGEAEVGLAVADPRRDLRPGMADQVKLHAARIPNRWPLRPVAGWRPGSRRCSRQPAGKGAQRHR